jgi:hypothetical protein
MNKMKKVAVIFIAFIMLLSLFGCGDTKTFDVNILADSLNSNLEFGEALEKSESEIAYSIYGIDSSLCTDAALYLGSGATADEIAVFNCVDKTSAQKVVESANNRLAYLLEGYSSYGPSDVPKIESAKVITEGLTVIVCICENHDSVAEFIK